MRIINNIAGRLTRIISHFQSQSVWVNPRHHNNACYIWDSTVFEGVPFALDEINPYNCNVLIQF